jgi:hypothetical protein
VRTPITPTQLVICLASATLLIVLVPQYWQKAIVAGSMLLVCIAFVVGGGLRSAIGHHRRMDISANDS